MPLFGKERHGKLTVIDPGRHYRWVIPNFTKYRPKAVLDSEITRSFDGADFHFHLSIGIQNEIGFYVHYKRPPIPKYSYYFTGRNGAPTRQQTAHTIPNDAERCGHWAAQNGGDLLALIGPTDELFIEFFFDDDVVQEEGLDDKRVTWKIRQFPSKYLNPFTSRGFCHSGSLYILRCDIKPSTGELVFFIFARKAVITAHSLSVTVSDGAVLGHLERKDELGAQTLTLPREAVLEACAASADKTLIVTLILHRTANPLEFFNTHGANSPKVAPRRTVQVGEKGDTYVTFDDE